MGETEPTKEELAAMIDHAFLRPEASRSELIEACRLVKELKVGCLCVRPCDVSEAKKLLDGSGIRLATVVGFPHGTAVAEIKAEEAALAAADGVDELDMVINIGLLRSRLVKRVRGEIAGVVQAARPRPVKVILECCYLNQREKAAGCRAAIEAGAHYVKTSTGLGPGGATIEDVRFLRRQVGEHMGVKAAGGIRTLADAIAMIRAGADRLGTSSSRAILSG